MASERIEPTESKELGGGQQRLYRFDNGYGASVIRNRFSAGNKDGLWELAVLKYNADGEHEVAEGTPVSADGYDGALNEDAIQEDLRLIRALPAVTA